MLYMSFNSGCRGLSNELLLASNFKVVPKLEGVAPEAPPLGTNVTKVGQAAEG
jgi:hypothetical protein